MEKGDSTHVFCSKDQTFSFSLCPSPENCVASPVKQNKIRTSKNKVNILSNIPGCSIAQQREIQFYCVFMPYCPIREREKVRWEQAAKLMVK